ncbi:MAG: LapA family protein [Candidatus Marinimicrobia bacterium]|nr:LapA family protein [Candidatus Neomarinimicrobiota bacterium]MCF7840239.1 LapA family protein [Candidatus Neomarinimicrobiota bacterium]
MRELKIFVILVLVLAAVWLLTQNSSPVDIKLFKLSYTGIPLYLVILLAFAVGALVGFGYGASQTLKLKSDIRVLNRERLKLQSEVDQRRVAMLDREDDTDMPDIKQDT